MSTVSHATDHSQSFTDALLAALERYRRPVSPYCCDDTDSPCRDCLERAMGEGYDAEGVWLPDAIDNAYAAGLAVGHDGLGAASPPEGLSGDVALAWWRGHSEGLGDLLDEMTELEAIEAAREATYEGRA